MAAWAGCMALALVDALQVGGTDIVQEVQVKTSREMIIDGRQIWAS